MKLHALGIDYRHDSNFSIERPSGSGDSLVLIFKTPAAVRLNNTTLHAAVGSALLYSPDCPQYYGADGGDFINHWVHFGLDGDDEFLKRIALPQNTLLPPCDITAAERVLALLNIESLSDTKGKSESCDLLLKLLLTKLSDSMERTEPPSVHSGALKELRAAIYRTPSDCYSIDMLAGSLSLSPSHFQHLYKQEFGISCYEDILCARHAMAKYYLKNTSLPIAQIAELCGFENDVHFIRQFRKRTGMTAGQFRKM